jgi:hypothetical protein
MNLRKLSDLCLLVLLAAAGSVQRFPVGHHTCADTSRVTPVKTKHSSRKPVSLRAPSTEAIHCETTWCDKTWRNA